MKRREFLKMSALSGLSTGLGLCFTTPLIAQTPAGRFDLGRASTELWSTPKSMLETAVLQSFAFDDTNGRIYYLQQLGSAEDGTQPGNLQLTYWLTDGTILNSHHMDLMNFGHGQSLGVEFDGTDTWIWMATDSDLTNSARPSRQICRFMWTGTGTFYPSDLGTAAMPGSMIWNLDPGSSYNDCTYDASSQRVLYRRNNSVTGSNRFRVYSANDLKTLGNSASPLYPEIDRPALPAGSTPLQGFTFYGNYGYYVSGLYYPGCTPDGSGGSIYWTCFNLQTGASVNHSQGIDASFDWREPEGMAIQIVDSQPWLHSGLMCRASCSVSEPDKTAMLYYKTSMINDGL